MLDEKDFYDEKLEKKQHNVVCPHCRQPGDYEIAWIVRTRKNQIPQRADERDRAKFAKAKPYMVRKDDMLACKNVRCRKRFEITGIQSVAFME